MLKHLVWLVAAFIVVNMSGMEVALADGLKEVIEVQKYARAIHIMAMLLVGFGFLMVFVKKYGRTAITATYLLVAVAIPLYFLKSSYGILGHAGSQIDSLILAEFAAASLLICAGAVLGRLKLYQYIVLGLLFIPCYAFNEWIVLDGGLGLIEAGSVADTGGSIVIHAFGAFLGFGAIFSLTRKKEFEVPVECDETSDRFSLLGSMVLWIFWPSFCAALVAPADIPGTVVNVIIALCGATLATYFASVVIRKKVSITDIANATLAGGVAIGSTCDKVGPGPAFVIGLLAGAVSTIGFAILQEKMQNAIKKVDTCGVMFLHGIPGLLGGTAAIVTVSGLNIGSQLKAMGITVVIAIVGGLMIGKIVSLLGSKNEIYLDDDELEVE